MRFDASTDLAAVRATFIDFEDMRNAAVGKCLRKLLRRDLDVGKLFVLSVIEKYPSQL